MPPPKICVLWHFVLVFKRSCCLGYARTIKKLFACRQTRVKFGISKLPTEAEIEEQLAIDTHSAQIASTAHCFNDFHSSITSHCSSGRTSSDFSSYSYSTHTVYDAPSLQYSPAANVIPQQVGQLTNLKHSPQPSLRSYLSNCEQHKTTKNILWVLQNRLSSTTPRPCVVPVAVCTHVDLTRTPERSPDALAHARFKMRLPDDDFKVHLLWKIN